MLSGWIWRRTNISLLLPRDLAIPRRRKCILLIPLALQSPSRRLECIQLKVFDCSFSKSTTCAAHNHLATLVGWRVYTWGEGHFGSFNATLPGTGESKEISPLRPFWFYLRRCLCFDRVACHLAVESSIFLDPKSKHKMLGNKLVAQLQVSRFRR